MKGSIMNPQKIHSMLGKGGIKVTLKLWFHSLMKTCLHLSVLCFLFFIFYVLCVFALLGRFFCNFPFFLRRKKKQKKHNKHIIVSTSLELTVYHFTPFDKLTKLWQLTTLPQYQQICFTFFLLFLALQPSLYTNQAMCLLCEKRTPPSLVTIRDTFDMRQ